ncbi:MAG: Ig-like domain-containing protein [Ideonella sp.]|nr:Ig-like domain-containing protein [Ideonella sp.]
MRKFIQAILMMAAGLLLAACGGGSDVPYCGPGCTPDGEGTSAGEPTVVVSISNTTVASGAPATVTATVRDGAGAALAGQVVSFSTNGGLGVFNANSALTDSSGVVTVELSPASPTSNGADLVVAQVTVADFDATGTIGFQVTPSSVPPVGSPSLSIALSTTTVTSVAPATVTSTVKDAAGNPRPNVVVKFNTIDLLGAFNPTSALSDANGIVSVKLSGNDDHQWGRSGCGDCRRRWHHPDSHSRVLCPICRRSGDRHAFDRTDAFQQCCHGFDSRDCSSGREGHDWCGRGGLGCQVQDCRWARQVQLQFGAHRCSGFRFGRAVGDRCQHWRCRSGCRFDERQRLCPAGVAGLPAGGPGRGDRQFHRRCGRRGAERVWSDSSHRERGALAPRWI